jgi:carbon storage regulator
LLPKGLKGVLISRRKEGEVLRIGDEVEIRVIDVRKKKVILGVLAPRDVKITSTKLSEAELANTMAAANSVDLSEFLHEPPVAGERVLFLLESGESADKKSGEAE